MKDKICRFAGHKDIYGNDPLQDGVYHKCEELVIERDVTCFWVGNYGDFDYLAARAVRNLKETYPHIRLELILPYITKEIDDDKERYAKGYDHVILSDIPVGTPARLKILKCNQYMVDRSDFLIAYVNYSFGGAVKTFEYAQKKHVEIFNFGTYRG